MPFVSSVQLLPLYIYVSHIFACNYYCSMPLTGFEEVIHLHTQKSKQSSKQKTNQNSNNYCTIIFHAVSLFFLDLFFPSLFSFLILYFSLVYICTIITNHNQLPIILQFIIVVKCVFWPFRLLSSCALLLASSSFVHLCADDTLWQSLRKNVFFLHDVCYVMFIFSFYFTLSPECLFSCCTFN